MIRLVLRLLLEGLLVSLVPLALVGVIWFLLA